MTGIFGALDIARKGMNVSQAGIRQTGHNIANVNTPGYSRQRLLQSADAPVRTTTGLEGMGVRVFGTERITDPFIQRQLIRQTGSAAASSAQADVLSQVEAVLNEQDSDGITAQLSQFYDSLDDLATSASPGAPAERAALVSSAQAVVDVLHSSDDRLRELMTSTNNGIGDLLPQANLLLEDIAELNVAITRSEVASGTPANDLHDQRDLKVRELAGLMDIHTYSDEKGSLSITLTNGVALVEGERARTLVAAPDAANPFGATFTRIQVHDLSNVTDVTNEIAGGEIGGRLRARDTILPGAIRSLDTIAYNLAESVNAVHQGGRGLNNAVGDFFTAPVQLEDSAKNLSLDAAIVANPDAIAAGLTDGPSDNRNALSLAALRDTKLPLFLPGDGAIPSGPTRSILEHSVAITVDVGQQTRSMASTVDQQDRIIESLENRREEVSGVSIDEEVTNLVRLQAAFQANARVISVVQNLLDDLVNVI